MFNIKFKYFIIVELKSFYENNYTLFFHFVTMFKKKLIQKTIIMFLTVLLAQAPLVWVRSYG